MSDDEFEICGICGSTEYKYEEMEYIPVCPDCYRCKPNWISVEDRLPEENIYILVLTKNNATYVAHFVDGDFYTKEEYRLVSIDDDSRYMQATHWMPLPEPPEVE